MKTLNTVKDEIAKEYGYEDFKYVLQNLSIAQISAIYDEVARRYAEEAVKDLSQGILSDFTTNPN